MSSVQETKCSPKKPTKKILVFCMLWGMAQDSAVSIAIGYRLDGPGIESQWGRNYLHPSRPALGPTQPPI